MPESCELSGSGLSGPNNLKIAAQHEGPSPTCGDKPRQWQVLRKGTLIITTRHATSHQVGFSLSSLLNSTQGGGGSGIALCLCSESHACLHSSPAVLLMPALTH